ncbi:cytochrome o ubiquinol oxidase subunit IV [Candidatus Saccharibacteria bacterium]|nr:cytochrome o ubiquinol oxidase subunit IV [Candidatus Saccharibacteria bacterium]
MRQATYQAYIRGFSLSIIVTLTAYTLVSRHLLAGWILVVVIICLAVIQAMIQLLFFLHLGRESKPKWNLVMFITMALVVSMLVAGSLWIMNNLNYHHGQTPAADETYIIKDEGVQQ